MRRGGGLNMYAFLSPGTQVGQVLQQHVCSVRTEQRTWREEGVNIKDLELKDSPKAVVCIVQIL